MKKTIWILLDNRMGSVGQAKGIMQEIDSSRYNLVTKELQYSRWAGLPNFIRRQSLIGIANPEILNGETPHLVLSTSRRTAPVALYLKKRHPEIVLVQLMYPGSYGINKFAKVFLPKHDDNKHTRPNFHFTVGSPHRVNQATLNTYHQEWETAFSHLPKPWTALIIGGAIKGKPFTIENAQALAVSVKNLKSRIGGSLLITDSRRTGSEAETTIMNTLQNIPCYSFLWGSKDKNPLMGYYACADNIIVTGDSVSMCCEACGTGKPVFVFEGKNWLTSKHLRFTKSLFDTGYATPLIDGCEKFTGGKFLYPSAEIAREIMKLV
ncbi:MAG: mitochondrial fission ELM1 family protein [Alphaproteobacteria bacterium]|nr:mitochondrial fission ELM1 family protein [Alphaproteobacteria bacterium]